MNFHPLLFFFILFGREVWALHSSCKEFEVKRVDKSDLSMTSSETSSYCPKSLNWTVLDQQTGLVEFQVPFVNKCDHNTTYEIILMKDGDKKFADIKWTNYTRECDNSSQFKEYVWEVNYIYKGDYSLKLQYFTQVGKYSYSSSSPCRINLTISTNYRREKINIPKPKVRSRPYLGIINQSLEIFAISDKHLPEKVIFDVYNSSDCSGKAILQASVTTKAIYDYHCSFIDAGQLRDKEDCLCVSRNETALNVMCSFSNARPGNYCVLTTYVDIRCCEHSIWMNDDEDCVWKQPIFVREESKGTTKEEPNNKTILIPTILGVTAIFLLTLSIMSFLIFKRKQTGFTNPNLPLLPKKLSVEEKPRVLLAYPRDCPLFMEAMAEFRKLLIHLTNAEVYDHWDSNMWESVAEKKDRWPLQYCYDENVKLIIVATDCSRFIHNALINGDEIEYTEPEPFDNVFQVILNTVMETSITEMPYKRIFVVRLDGDDVEANTFKYISPFTIYTIPQQLNTLAKSLQNGDHFEMNQTISAPNLSTLINDLNLFKSDNRDYINNMIRIRNAKISESDILKTL